MTLTDASKSRAPRLAPMARKYVALICLAFGSSLFAAPTSPSLDCRRSSGDEFEPRLVFKQGSFKGQCVDASSVRPPQILSESADRMLIANFYDQSRFWKADVAKNAVEQVLFQIVPFASGVPLIQAAHAQLRFRLDPSRSIRLTSQDSGHVLSGESHDVIISSTFTAPAGVEYSAMRSLGGSFGIVTRFMSAYARGREEIQKDKSTVRQFDLRLTLAEKNRLFELALRRASLDGYANEYRLLNENCATVTFDDLDAVRPRPPGVAAVRGSWWHIFDEFIAPSIHALAERKLIDERSEIQPMNDEMKF